MRTVLIEKFNKRTRNDFLRTKFYFVELSLCGEIQMCSISRNGETRVFENCIYIGESNEFWFFISDSGCMDLYVIAKDRRRKLFEEGMKNSPSSEFSSEFRGRLIDQMRSYCPFFEEVIYRNYDGLMLQRAESGLQTANKIIFETVIGVSKNSTNSINFEIVEFYRKYINEKRKL